MNAGENKESRGGRYVQQPTGYRAFIPAPLPPQPPIDLSGPLRELLSKADYALGRLDGAVLTLPNPDLFVFMYVRKEAVLSSQIEGTQSSLQNLLAAEARQRSGHAGRCGRGGQLRAGDEPRADASCRTPRVRTAHPRDSRRAHAGRARRTAHSGGTAHQPELDRPRRLYAARGHLCSAAAPGGAAGTF